MGRVFFTDTCTIPSGPAGSLMPLAGIAYIPFSVNPDGSEGSQANAYVDRTSNVAATTLATGDDGSVGYWLDAGDYNIHVSDQQLSPRIPDSVRGFTAPIIDLTQIVVTAQNLIQFTGDTKHSIQSADHGLKPDGSYEWLLVASDPDGGGRKIDHTIYSALWSLMGSPTPDGTGKFRLPNISGRSLIAAGAATGLTNRNLFDMVGEETHVITTSEMAAHAHSITDGGHAHSITDPSHAHSIADGGHSHSIADPGHSHLTSVDGYHVPGRSEAWSSGDIGFFGTSASPAQVMAPLYSDLHDVLLTSNGSTGIGINNGSTGIGINNGTTGIGINNGTTGISIDSTGLGSPHNNIQPSCVMNLFVKS